MNSPEKSKHTTSSSQKSQKAPMSIKNIIYIPQGGQIEASEFANRSTKYKSKTTNITAF